MHVTWQRSFSRAASLLVVMLPAVIVLSVLAVGCGSRGGSREVRFHWVGEDDTRVFSQSRPKLELVEVSPRPLNAEPIYRGEHRYTLLPLGNVPGQETVVAVSVEGEGDSAGASLFVDGDRDGDLAEESAVELERYPDDPGYFHREGVSLSWVRQGPSGREEPSEAFDFVLAWLPQDKEWTLRLSYHGRMRGELALGDGSRPGIRCLLYDADVNGVYDTRDLLVIDTNEDSLLDGDRNSVEVFALTEPFVVRNDAMKVREVSLDGTWVRLSRGGGKASARVALVAGMRAPDFTLRDQAGELVGLSSYRGKPLLLAFWATW